MRNLRHVALLVETSRETGRGILRGISRYHQEHGGWSLYFQPHGIDDSLPKWLADWHGHGIIARVNDRRAAQLLLKTGLPVVEVRGAVVTPQFQQLEIDNRILTKMVVEHFLDRGLKKFAFCGYAPGRHRLYDARRDAFVAEAKQHGGECRVYLPRGDRGLSWDDEQRELAKWVKSLPAPIGIMACNDDLGLNVMTACRRIQRAVPDEVAVIGVENDPFLCNLSSPPLTSVDVNPERVGYEACLLLEELMHGGKPQDCLRLPPAQIVERRSTDVLAIDDPAIVQAIRHIHKHACLGLTVSELVKLTSMSPSLLNRRFHETIGRCPKDEITRVQMTRARELLINTDLSIHAIARSCGFEDSNYFSKRFHDQHGASPRRYRLRAAK